MVATHIAQIDEDLTPDVHRLLQQVERADRVVQPRLRHRYQIDRHGLTRTTHRLVGDGGEFRYEIDGSGDAVQHTLGAIYCLERLDVLARHAVAPALRKAMRWRGPIDSTFLSYLVGSSGATMAGVVDPRAWALDMLGFTQVRDVAPGEAVFIDEAGRLHAQQCVATTRHTPCIFEFVYFARPDSIIDNVSVQRARMRMGERLAEKIKRERPEHDIDVVIPIPDTSRTAALQVAQILGVKYREGFIKNRYIGRTFIMPGQEQRQKSVRSKLNAIDLEFRNKNVLLVDDSIVRGTTSAQIIDLAREAGARNVYFASAAPPVRYP
ncbi:MAG: hypothetical protein EBY84_05895, partial [Acidimicrobiia bacterium]|nr:hypothetical protein [Acidimicrobiia bacterium]